MPKRLSISAYRDGVLSGDRVTLARAITLIESRLDSDQELAEELLAQLMPHTGGSMRVGISGVPGVGKSTFIDALGTYLTEEKKQKLAVLAIDPSSGLSRGSILGDKTRMARLSVNPMAFIRPSASGGTLGGVAARTRESVLLCEAAGYDWVIVETVGVGQSETVVREMVDFFLLLMLAGAGDELQGIKRGIMEICDGLFINKADGENERAAKRAAADYSSALHLFREQESGWIPKVGTVSSIEGKGIDEVCEVLEQYRRQTTSNGFFDQNRTRQETGWLEDMIEEALLRDFSRFRQQDPAWGRILDQLGNSVIPVRTAYRQAMEAIRARK